MNKRLLAIKDLRENIAQQKDKQQAYVLIKDYCLKHYKILSSWYTNEIWIYKEGRYVQNGEGFLLEEIHEIVNHYSKTARNEIIEKIRIETVFYENPFDKQNIIVLSENTILLDNLIEGKEFCVPHDPKYLSTKKLDVIYNPESQCPNINNFLNQVTTNDKKFENYLIESIADCLNNHYQSQILHLFVGEGSNGKGTFLRVLAKFLGEQNTSNLGFGLIRERGFQTYILEQSLANIAGDTSNKLLGELGLIKKLTGEDRITVDVKHARKPISFTNKSKQFVSSQNVLKFDEDSHGLYRRFCLTDWNFEVNDKEKILNFEETLQTKDELSGLLNRVLEAYKTFYKRNFVFEITENMTREEKRENYLIKSKPVKVFVERCLEDNSESLIIKLDLYNVFCEFSRKNNIPILTQIQFGKDLKSELPNLTQRQIDRKRHYVGIELKEDWKDFIKPKDITNKKTVLDFKEPIITLENEIWNKLISEFCNQNDYTLDEIKSMLKINIDPTNDELIKAIKSLEAQEKIKESKIGQYYGNRYFE